MTGFRKSGHICKTIKGIAENHARVLLLKENETELYQRREYTETVIYLAIPIRLIL